MANEQKITVICTAPGMIRGGRRNPAIAHYTTGEFSRDELAEVVADPNFYVVLGTQLDADGIAALWASPAAAKKAGKGA